jgi:predicted short-subunit dehydrogenase-like oxidoreductase (DUF2520 family)
MGQVPNHSALSLSPSYGIIGDGRVAEHMAHYFRLREIPFRVWSRRLSHLPPATELCQQDIILVLIKDSAIEKWIDDNPTLQQKTLVHFSGSLVTKKAFGAHPLMTFGHELYDLEVYEKIPFIFEEGQKHFDGLRFQNLFPRLKNPSHSIHHLKKPLYHAYCVMSQNFTTLLWQKFFKELESQFHIPSDAAKPILEQTLINLLKNPEASLTGPLARADMKTIQANIESLKDDSFQNVYEAFVSAHKKDQLTTTPRPYHLEAGV